MRATRLTLLAAAMVMIAPSVFGADTMWGSVTNGLRIGLDYGPDLSKHNLHISLQNVGNAVEDIFIGSRVGTGVILNISFLAALPNGQKRHGSEINSFTPLAALTVPVVIPLKPEATHELYIPLKNVFVIEKGQRTFDDLVSERASLQITFDTTGMGAMCPGPPVHCWIGKVTSGTLAPRQ